MTYEETILNAFKGKSLDWKISYLRGAKSMKGNLENQRVLEVLYTQHKEEQKLTSGSVPGNQPTKPKETPSYLKPKPELKTRRKRKVKRKTKTRQNRIKSKSTGVLPGL